MIGRALAILMLTAGAAAASETATSPDFTCKLSEPATFYDSLKALPPPFAAFVAGKVSGMAERGAFFNATDALVKPGPMRRFIRAGHLDRRWFLWYEQGGIAYYKNILVFADYDGKGIKQTDEDMAAWNSDLCARTDAILNRRPPAH